MEPFTLVVWLMIGQRFEELRIEGLTRAECTKRAGDIFADRGKSIGKCVSANGIGRPVMPAAEPDVRDCASHHFFRGSCVWPLPPGRRRV
jgi:hypothetical protein